MGTGGEGVRWHVIRQDLRTFGTRIKEAFRSDWTVWVLLAANLSPIIELVRSEEPVVAILVIYWMQMMIIGFWNVLKLVVISRWMALVQVPVFLVMYLSVVNLFGLISGILIDDQLRGTSWHEGFSLWTYRWPALLFFVSHGVSFWANFIRWREFEYTRWDDQIGMPLLRAVPMWLAVLAGAVLGSFFNSASMAVLAVVPMKIGLDLLGHFSEHGLLSFGDAD